MEQPWGCTESVQRNGEAWGETFKNLLSRTGEIINPICFSVLNSVRKYRGREHRPSERELVSLEATEPWPGTARTVSGHQSKQLTIVDKKVWDNFTSGRSKFECWQCKEFEGITSINRNIAQCPKI